MEEDTTTFYEILRTPWPGGGEWVQELAYRVNAVGQVVPNEIFTTEERSALQALVDLRGPEARKPGRGNSLEEISADSPEARLSHALALALLSPEKRQEYHQLQEQEERIETARALVREAHQPVCFDPGFYLGEIESLEDGTGLMEVTDTGPNWTHRYTLYILGPGPEIEILQAYTPFGEHCINHHFHAGPIYEPDDSRRFDDFRAVLAHIWQDTTWLK